MLRRVYCGVTAHDWELIETNLTVRLMFPNHKDIVIPHITEWVLKCNYCEKVEPKKRYTRATT